MTPVGANATMLCHRAISGDAAGVGETLFNRLEPSAFGMYPGLLEARERLEATGLFAGVLMSGSGSALFGLCKPDTWERAAESAAALQLGTCCRVQGVSQGVVVSRV